VRGERGFTLIEVLMALSIFALIAAIAYGAMASAGQGFRQLQDVRDVQERAGWLGRQLRSDVAYLSDSAWQSRAQGEAPRPVMIGNDNRGVDEFDELDLFVREPGRPGVALVRYFIDEQAGHLIRESRLLWADEQAEPLRWDLGPAASLAVEAMDRDGRWQQEWKPAGAGFVWPRALRVRMKTGEDSVIEREWVLPVETGAEL